MLSNAGTSFDNLSKEPECLKGIIRGEVDQVPGAMEGMNNRLQETTSSVVMGNQLGIGGNGGYDRFEKSTMEHEAISNLGVQSSHRTGFRECNDKLVNALAQVNREYRVIIKTIIQAIDQEGNLPWDKLDQRAHWLNGNGN